MRRVASRLSAARRAGRGVYVGEWRFEAEAVGDVEALREPVLAWCRETLARCRRPWGIDYFDLALSWSSTGARGPRSIRFPELRPAVLYDGGLAEHIAAFLSEMFAGAAADASGRSTGFNLAAGLFSWGEAAHAALPAAT